MGSRYYSPFSRSSSPQEVIVNLLCLLLAAFIWALIWWYVISKAGYRGKARWWWLAGMMLPFLPPSWITLSCLLLVPWPVNKQVKGLKEKVELLQAQVGSQEQQIERNVEYIRNANLKIQSLQEQLVQKG